MWLYFIWLYNIFHEFLYRVPFSELGTRFMCTKYFGWPLSKTHISHAKMIGPVPLVYKLPFSAQQVWSSLHQSAASSYRISLYCSLLRQVHFAVYKSDCRQYPSLTGALATWDEVKWTNSRFTRWAGYFSLGPVRLLQQIRHPRRHYIFLNVADQIIFVARTATVWPVTVNHAGDLSFAYQNRTAHPTTHDLAHFLLYRTGSTLLGMYLSIEAAGWRATTPCPQMHCIWMKSMRQLHPRFRLIEFIILRSVSYIL